MKRCIHLELAAYMTEQLVECAHIGQVGRGFKVHPHEEQAGGVIPMHITELL